jgi:hypothetical protein
VLKIATHSLKNSRMTQINTEIACLARFFSSLLEVSGGHPFRIQHQ